VEDLEQAVTREGRSSSLDPKTRRAIVQSLHLNTATVELAREIAALEDYEQIRSLDGRTLYRSELPRMREQAAREWRKWITIRFGDRVAEAFLFAERD
jgi:hypothetical protein